MGLMGGLTKRRLSGGGSAAIIAGLMALGWPDGSRGEAVQAPVAPALSAEEAEGVIFERQQLMLQLDKDAKALGMIAAGAMPPKELAATTRSIAQGAKDSVTAFDQVVPGGRSKPEVWTQHPAFMADMRTFALNAEKMAQAGESGNLAEVTNLMIDALPCKQCHDRYRGPKPS
jgi:cytochrome c556